MSLAKGRNKQTHKQKTSNPNKHTDVRSLWWYEHNRVRRGKTFLLTGLAGRGSYLPSTSACLQECECVCADSASTVRTRCICTWLNLSSALIDSSACPGPVHLCVNVCVCCSALHNTHGRSSPTETHADAARHSWTHTHTVLLKFNLLCHQRCSEYMRYFWIWPVMDI